MDRRGERCYAPFGGGRVSPHLTQCDWAEAYLCTKWHLDPSSRLATTDMGRKSGAVPLWGEGAGAPSNTLWPGTRPTSVPSGILIHPAVWSQQTWDENWGCCAEAYLRTKWYLDTSSHLATMHGPKSAVCSAPCLFFGGAGSPSNTMSPGPRHISAPSGSLIHLAVWTQQTLAENFGVLCPFGGGDSWSPAYTLWSWPRPTSVLSFVLIHPTV